MAANRKKYWPVSLHCYPCVLTLTIFMNGCQILPQISRRLLKTLCDYYRVSDSKRTENNLLFQSSHTNVTAITAACC